MAAKWLSPAAVVVNHVNGLEDGDANKLGSVEIVHGHTRMILVHAAKQEGMFCPLL